MDSFYPWPPRPAPWRAHCKAAAYLALEVVSFLGFVAGLLVVFVMAFA